MYKTFKPQAFALMLLLVPLSSCASFNQGSRSKYDSPLRSATYDGKWAGVVKCVYDPGLWPDEECDFSVTFSIKNESLSVVATYRNKDGKETTSEVYPGKFKFIRQSTNAIAFVQSSGNDEDGTWVETWSFDMTLKDPKHMLVHWTRIVNNVDMSPHNKFSKFSTTGMGELRLIENQAE